MTAEGIYIGLAGGVKRLWHYLPDSTGDALYTLGLFLEDINKPFNEADITKCHIKAKEMSTSFHQDNHSGGSAMVAQQMLLAVFGANAVDEITRKYILTMDEP